MNIPKACKIELACSKDASREAIAHPYLDQTEPDKPVIVATSGSVLAVIVPENAKGETAGHIPVDAIKRARKAAKGSVLLFADDKGVVADGATFARAPHKFPNWRAIMPKGDKHTLRLGLDVRKLWDLAQAMGTEGLELRLIPGDPSKNPVMVTPLTTGNHSNPGVPPANPDAYGLIMPIALEQKQP